MRKCLNEKCYMSPAADPAPPDRLEAKRLYRRLDHLFGAWDRSRPQGEMLETFMEELFGSLKEDLRLRAVFLYGERRDSFELISKVGDTGPGKEAEELDKASPVLNLVFKHRVYIFADPDAEGTPHRLELLPRSPTA